MRKSIAAAPRRPANALRTDLPAVARWLPIEDAVESPHVCSTDSAVALLARRPLDPPAIDPDLRAAPGRGAPGWLRQQTGEALRHRAPRALDDLPRRRLSRSA